MPRDISYSDGSIVKNAVIVVWEDNHNERAGYFRAYWAASPDGTSGSPVIGYASSGGSHKTIKAVAREVLKFHPKETVYRNGRPVKL
jgi:hypothetical protein